MKLKKTLSIIMAATLSIFTITGCSVEEKNYSKEVDKLAKWEAINTEFNGEISVEADGLKENFKFNGEGYIQEQTKGHMNFKFNNASGKIKLPDMDMYLNNGLMYVNKDYYINNFTLNGIEAPEGIKNIPAEYIAIDSGMNVNALVELTKSPDYLSNLVTQFLGKNNDIAIPMKQNDREYSVDMNSDEIVDLASKVIGGLSENLDNNDSITSLGLNEDIIKQFKNNITDPSFKTMLEQAKPMIKGSTLSTKEKFADDGYTANVNMNFEIANTVKVTIKINSVSKKAESKDIEIPINKTVLTQEQFVNIIVPEQVQAQLQGK